jgi:hypothetical protein
VTRDDTADPADPVGAAAADLYGLPLGEFTEARGERARQARSGGDAEAARAIGRLAKPTVVAWLANQLARDDPAGIAGLLALGTSMRAATAALDAAGLRQLSRRQHDLVQGMVGRARDRAAGAGLAFSAATERGLAETLHAALADEQAAAQLTAGRLTAALSRSGFPGIDARAAGAAGQTPDSTRQTARPPAETAPSPPAGQRAPARQGAPAGPGTARQASAQARERRAAQAAARAAAAEAARRAQLDRAREAEAQARQDAGDVAAELEHARAALARAQDAAAQAAADITRLQEELDAALADRDAAGRAQRRARQALDRAERADRQARRRVDEAAARRSGLEEQQA